MDTIDEITALCGHAWLGAPSSVMAWFAGDPEQASEAVRCQQTPPCLKVRRFGAAAVAASPEWWDLALSNG